MLTTNRTQARRRQFLLVTKRIRLALDPELARESACFAIRHVRERACCILKYGVQMANVAEAKRFSANVTELQQNRPMVAGVTGLAPGFCLLAPREPLWQCRRDF